MKIIIFLDPFLKRAKPNTQLFTGNKLVCSVVMVKLHFLIIKFIFYLSESFKQSQFIAYFLVANLVKIWLFKQQRKFLSCTVYETYKFLASKIKSHTTTHTFPAPITFLYNSRLYHTLVTLT